MVNKDFQKGSEYLERKHSGVTAVRVPVCPVAKYKSEICDYFIR